MKNFADVFSANIKRTSSLVCYIKTLIKLLPLAVKMRLVNSWISDSVLGKYLKFEGEYDHIRLRTRT